MSRQRAFISILMDTMIRFVLRSVQLQIPRQDVVRNALYRLGNDFKGPLLNLAVSFQIIFFFNRSHRDIFGHTPKEPI